MESFLWGESVPKFESLLRSSAFGALPALSLSKGSAPSAKSEVKLRSRYLRTGLIQLLLCVLGWGVCAGRDGSAEWNLGLRRFEIGTVLSDCVVATSSNPIVSGPLPDLDHAVALHRQGRWDEAEKICRRLLRSRPQDASVRHLLGLVAYQRGSLTEAAELIAAAIRANPRVADFHNNLGEVYRAQNRMAEAAKRYGRALQLNPNYAHAHNNLGLARKVLGERALARSSFQSAVQVVPAYAEAWANLGVLEQEEGNLPVAVACFERSVAANAGFAPAFSLLGQALNKVGRSEDAVVALRRSIQLQPDFADAHYNLGLVLLEQGIPAAAAEEFTRAVALAPEFPEAHNSLGLCAKSLGHLDEAIRHFDRAIELRKDYAGAYNNRGLAQRARGEAARALADYRMAVELQPTDGPALSNLGCILLEVGQLDAARAALQRALASAVPPGPECAGYFINLGNVCKEQGYLDEAITCYRRAVELQPERAALPSNLLLALHYHADTSPTDLARAHREWGARHGGRYRRSFWPAPATRDRSRRLRVGYISPDFRNHAVARFMEPLLKNHDHAAFEIFCYADVLGPDAVTARLKNLADHWQGIAARSDDDVADMVRRDQVDILVDLAAHTAGNRLAVLARKPAPVQVTYLAYCSTTGLAAIDYRISDPFLDPAEIDLSQYTEQTVRLPESYWCYPPPEIPVEVNELPARTNQQVTFGCLNNFCKVTDATLRLWCRVLHAVPGARLLVYSIAGSHRERVAAAFRDNGIAATRLAFVDYQPFDRYLGTYRDIDIGLDPVPFTGGTTTCDALWMGVPVITLAGRTAVSRGGSSLLSNVGLPEWVVRTEDDYVRKAVEMARDLAQVARLRAELRGRMQHSPLMDAVRFARNFEEALRSMWQGENSEMAANVSL